MDTDYEANIDKHKQQPIAERHLATSSNTDQIYSSERK